MSERLDKFSLVLYHLIINGGGLQAVTEAAYRTLHNPISVNNAQLEMVAHYQKGDTGDEFWELHNSPNMTDHYDLERRFEQSAEQVSTEPYIYHFPHVKHPIMSCAAESEGKTVAYVHMLEYDKPFGGDDVDLLREFAQVVAYLIVQSRRSVKDPRTSQQLILLRLANGDFVPKEVVNRYLAKNDTSLRYRVIVFESKNRVGKELVPGYMSDIVAQLCPQLKTCPIEGKLVALVQDRYERLAPQRIIELLAPLTQERNWICGVSNPFYNVFNLEEHYRSALDALACGQRYLPGKTNVYFFDVVAFTNFIDLVQPTYDLNQLCEPIFKYLRHYDDDHDTSYFKTLVVFTANHMNMKESSEELHIHRSTLQYRIDKIVEISGDDNLLADPFRLELSVRIIFALSPEIFERYGISTDAFTPMLGTLSQ